jgi:hypothetical protein
VSGAAGGFVWAALAAAAVCATSCTAHNPAYLRDDGLDGGGLAMDAGAIGDAAEAMPILDALGPGLADTKDATPDAARDTSPDLAADASPPDAVAPTGTGLHADYFDGVALESGTTGTIDLQRIDGPIDFDWAAGRPSLNVDDDYFSVRWTGQVLAAHSETYTFTTVTDDGVRLWVNGVKLIDGWTTQRATRSGTIRLEANRRYDIKMEYFEQTGTAEARLYWATPSTPSQIVPRANLFPP